MRIKRFVHYLSFVNYQFVEGIRLDLADYNNSDKWILPVPATFMIAESVVIRSAYINPNFMRLRNPEEILRELRKPKCVFSSFICNPINR